MDTYSGTVDNPVETRATTIHSLWISTIGSTMGPQLKRPGWCVNTSESGPNPDKEGYVNLTANRYLSRWR